MRILKENRSLGTENLVKLEIGPSARTVQVQKTLLEDVSPWFKERIELSDLDHYNFMLRVDDVEAWKVLLFWLMKKHLPSELETTKLLLVKTWVLCEKYGIASFQDEVMLELLIRYERHAM